MVSSNKRNAKNEGKERGEKLFLQSVEILKANFPPNEIESEEQYRLYFHSNFPSKWFFDVVVDQNDDAIGVLLYDFSPKMKTVMFNIVAVKEENRRLGIARMLIDNACEQINCIAKKVEYLLGEIQRPDLSITGNEGQMRNMIRPAFHDAVTGLRALALESGEPLMYMLPLMAPDEEREEAKKKGEPFEPEPLLFCIRPNRESERDGINARSATRLLLWFYKDYLGGECEDVKPDEVNGLLAETLTQIVPSIEIADFVRILREADYSEKILEMIPDIKLKLMLISETATNR